MSRTYTSKRHIKLLIQHFKGDKIISPDIIDSVLTSIDENTHAIHTLELVSEDDFIMTFLEKQYNLAQHDVQRFLDAYNETFELAIRDE